MRLSNKNTVTVGLIGAGYWGSNYLRVLSSLPIVDLVWCSDLDAGRLRDRVSRKMTIRVTSDYRNILNDPTVDAVVISTPASAHYSQCLEALKAGKHVLVEKPMAGSSKACKELRDTARKVDRILMVGHIYLFNAYVRTLEKLKSQMGELCYTYSIRAGLGPVRTDANALWDLAPHDISVLLYLLSADPLLISAHGACYVSKNVPDIAFLNLVFKNDIMSNIHVSWLDPLRIRRLTLVGKKRMGVFDEMDNVEKLRIFDSDASLFEAPVSMGESRFATHWGSVYSPAVPAATEPLKEQCSHFVDCILHGSRPISDGDFGLRVVRILELAQASLDRGSEVIHYTPG